MKYSLRYIILAFPLFLCLSCVDQMQDKAWNDGDFVLDLSVSCMKTDTKAGPELWPGIEEYNENKVAYVDWYVFKSATDTDNALLHGRATVTQTSGQTEGLKVTEQDMGQYVTDSQRSFYVYTIANMPELTHDAMPKTLAGLQALELAAGFNTQTFAAQESFVMAAGQSVTFTDPGLTKVTNKLSRLASKVSVNMNVTPAIDQFTILSNGEWTYMRTWYPELASIQVYLSFANSATTVKGDAVSYDQDTFFTYYRTGFKPEYSYTGDTAEQYSASVPSTTPVWTNEDWRWKVKGSPFYSYPMQWAADSPQAPFIKVILKWSAYIETVDPVTVDGETKLVPRREKTTPDTILENHDKEFYYKIPLPGTVLNANDWYDLTFNIAILGSTADELPVELAGQYCVMNWSDPEVHAGGELKQGRYLTTASDTYYMYGADEIEIPVVSSHALATGSAVVTKREVLYDGAWVTTAGTSAPSQVRNLSSRTLSVTAPGDGRSVLKFENELNTAMNTELDCYPMRFTLKLSHSDGLGTSKEIVIYQYPPIYVDSKPGGNAMVDGYYGNVNGYYLCRRFRQNNGSGNPNDSNYNSGSSTGNYANYHTGVLQTGDSGTSQSSSSQTNNIYNGFVYVPYGRIARYVDTQTSLTVLTISSFGSNSTYSISDGNNTYNRTYTIADPRQASGYSTDNYNTQYQLNDASRRRPLVPYYDGTRNVEWGETAAKIMIGNRTTPDLIAPKIIIASRWSRMVNSSGTAENGYDAMERRCATYQEAGYPAGRWRLPTEAEVNFVANLQRLGIIQNLFTGNGWISNGTATQIGTNSVTLISSGNTARCVYDAWYWGEDPVLSDDTKYTVMVD